MGNAKPAAEGKLVPRGEYIAYMASLFFFTNMINVIGYGLRNKYLSDLGLEGETVALINTICNVVMMILPFFFTMIVDRAPKPGRPKFIPLVTLTVIPTGVFAVLMFYTPQALLTREGFYFILLIVYQCVVTVLFQSFKFFSNTINQIAVVITPNHGERDSILSWRGILSAISAAGPILVVAVFGLLKKPGILKDDAAVYLVSAVGSVIVGNIAVLLGLRRVKERVVYSSTQQNPLIGFWDILKNRYARILMYSEMLKNFRSVAGFMEIYMVAVLLGDATKFILFGLPTAAGTFVGMMAVNFLLKKFNSRQIIICSGFYSICANAIGFAAGITAFRHEGALLYQVIFYACLFLIGIQFGASNLLPNMFKADVLEDLEAKTHKRLEASLDFVAGIGSNITGAIAYAVAPIILFGVSALNFIHYIQPISGVEQAQSYHTKVMILLVYTIGQGVFQLLCAMPFFFYKLTGARKEQVHEEVMAYRAELEREQGG